MLRINGGMLILFIRKTLPALRKDKRFLKICCKKLLDFFV